jgi:hypothetical protein
MVHCGQVFNASDGFSAHLAFDDKATANHLALSM